jgi:hypothetical protein
MARITLVHPQERRMARITLIQPQERKMAKIIVYSLVSWRGGWPG